MGVFKRLAREYRRGFRNIRRNLRLTDISELHFVRSEWEAISLVPSWKYISWKFLYCIFMTATLSFVLWRKANQDILKFKFFFVYLTNWTLILQTILCMLHLALLLKRRLYASTRGRNVVPRSKFKEGSEEMGGDATSSISMTVGSLEDASNMSPGAENRPENSASSSYIFNRKCSKVESLIWLTWTVTSSLIIFVCLGFWTAIYNSKDERFKPIFPSILTHGLNGIFGIVDIFLVAIPVRVTHGIYTFLFCAIYAVFTAVYELIAPGKYEFDSTYIYYPLNWHEKPYHALVAIIAASLAMFLIHFLVWLLYVLRLRIVLTCSKRKDKELVLDYHEYLDSSMNLANVSNPSTYGSSGVENPAYVPTSKGNETGVGHV